MLTLVQTKDAIPLLDIYAAGNEKKTSARKKRLGTVYFTHDMQKDNQNVATAAGVLQSPLFLFRVEEGDRVLVDVAGEAFRFETIASPATEPAETG